ncbi:hypothetical protein BAUCODRAFT_30292 [Baudoinia panamericana UAMH 10762]|uniref:Uncharacterized protein n=1 Tax=Baudoinia panamericana (strain UAMH 10762) TaxID=717646 RepID=M2MSM5_BAUPA|nr:uncharacterized protein BAUCODRAFT_30292 [Baudoinia panamericana UAMH 10762]EMC99881.1 hypothetical protein BAUCODRAFT_30292 [Baudoinia panamericana UAMH 10762]
MSSLSQALESPLTVNGWHEEQLPDHDDQTSSKPLSGTGASRQTRRLQLRNAGFRAPAVPSRKVTPKSTSTSTNWSAMSGLLSGSDVENRSPSLGVKTQPLMVGKSRKSSSVLQEIDNGGGVSVGRPKKARAHVPSARLFDNHIDTAPASDSAYIDLLSSPQPPRSTIRAKSVRAKAKMSKPRRSVSGEARMYIDHLEAELASVQSQLQAVNSPSVTREKTSRMRTLNYETRQLQDEVAEWEAKYEQRVQEIVEEHCGVEVGLRAQIRRLEEDAEETAYRLQELEAEVEDARRNVEAVEAANVQLEKRLGIMSELLAASPGKVDSQAETPGFRGRHRRPKSMLPRFPTASSLVASPERAARTQPTSPLFTFSHAGQTVPQGLEETSSSQSEVHSDAESVFSERQGLNGSVTSLEASDGGILPFNPWTLQAVQSAKSRPARRMRRFGPGTHGPKALILPSTSQCDFVPSSAPPLERCETTPAFAFPLPQYDRGEQEDGSPSTMVVRRRASTTADQTTLENLAASPFLQVPVLSPCAATAENDFDGGDSMLCPLSAQSQATTREYSSLGSAAGRNLMDELWAVRTVESALSFEEPSRAAEDAIPSNLDAEDTTLPHGKEVAEGTGVHSVLSTDSRIRPIQLRQRARSQSVECNVSTWQRLHALFGDLRHAPIALAQHVIQKAASRIRIPKPLLNVQWWLVGVLLGPMARRRMLTSRSQCNERRPLLEAYSPPQTGTDDAMAYGTMYHTPPGSPKLVGKTGGEGEKRVEGKKCMHWTKHSPWLWLKLSITLAFAVGVAFKEGPGYLMKKTLCGCNRKKDQRQQSALLEA